MFLSLSVVLVTKKQSRQSAACNSRVGLGPCVVRVHPADELVVFVLDCDLAAAAADIAHDTIAGVTEGDASRLFGGGYFLIPSHPVKEQKNQEATPRDMEAELFVAHDYPQYGIQYRTRPAGVSMMMDRARMPPCGLADQYRL